MATSEWLLLRLPSGADEAATWAVADASGAVAAASATGIDPAAAAAGRNVALVVPAADVALFAVQLPPASEQRQLQLVPFALEEQVSEDLDQLHFAIGARDGDTGLVPVAVAARERMAQWLAQAAALGVRPKAMFAESDLAPLVPGHVTLLLSGEQIILRNDGGRPVAFPADDPPLALAALLGAGTDTSTVNLVIHASPEDWERHEAALESLRAQVATFRVQLFTSGMLGAIAPGITGSSPVNLLQGAFKVQSPAANHWQRWRTAALLLLGLLLLHTAGTLWQLRQQNQESARLDAEISRVYGSIFPGQSPGPAPRRAIEARLQAVAGGGAQSGELMPMLAALAAARQNVPAARLESMNFRPGTLQLRLSAPDAATLEQYSQALKAGGYGANVSSGNQGPSGFEGVIDVTESGT
jgi:general secretion pathway protein L